MREDIRDGGETLVCEPREGGRDLAAVLGWMVSYPVRQLWKPDEREKAAQQIGNDDLASSQRSCFFEGNGGTGNSSGRTKCCI